MSIFVITLVMIDIGSILYFELGVEEGEKDCQKRDTLIQQQLTVFVLSFFCAELIFKCIGQGFTHFLAFRQYAVWNWFDFIVITLSVILAAVKYAIPQTLKSTLWGRRMSRSCPPVRSLALPNPTPQSRNLAPWQDSRVLQTT